MSELLPPDCAGPDRYLVDLVFDETTSVPEAVREHVDGCVRCLEALAELRHVRDRMGALPLEEPSEAMDDRIFAALDTQLAGGDVGGFVKLPDPEFALGAKRLTALLSQTPSVGNPRAPAESPRRSGTASPWAGSNPEPSRARPGRRRWPAAFAAAASVVVVAGGALYLSKESGQSPMMAVSASREEPADGEKDNAKSAASPASPMAAPKGDADRTAADKRKESTKDASRDLGGDSKGLGAFGATRAGPAPVEAKPSRKAVSAQLAETSEKQRVVANGLQALDGEGAGAGRAASGGFGQQASSATHASKKAAKEERSAGAVVDDLDAVADAPSGGARPEQSRAANASPAPTVAVTPPPPPAPVATAPAARMAEKSDQAEEPAAWSAPMSQARAAARRGDNRAAAAEFALVIANADAPPAIVREALEGRVQALMALNRLDEAQAAADVLAKRFPTVTAAQERVRRAKAMAAQPAPAKAPAAAAPAAPPPASLAAPAEIDAK